MKESGLRIRVDDDLRSSFINVCKKTDLTAAQVLRAYMRNYVEQHTKGEQADLFKNRQSLEEMNSGNGK